MGPVLTAHELYRFYHMGDEETAALRGVSLTVHRGEMVAVVGPSGSGKSTLMACLAGLDEPDGGHVVVAGARLTRRPESQRATLRARHIGVLLQSGNLIEHLTVARNIALAQSLAGSPQEGTHEGAGSFLQNMRPPQFLEESGRPPRPTWPRRRWRRLSQHVAAPLGSEAHQDTPAELLAGVGLAGRAGARPSTLSGGEAARAGLAVALANDPEILLADEPTAEVDGANEERVLELLRRRVEAGRAVVVATHSTRVAAASDRVVRIVDGRIAGA